MSNNLASSIFTSGPKDSFAAVDAYADAGKGIINSLPKIDSSALSDIFKSVKFKNAGFDPLGTALALNKTVLGEQLKAGITGLGLKVGDFSANAMNKAQSLLEKTNISAQALSCTVGEYTSKIDFKDAMRMAKLGASLTTAKNAGDVFKIVNQKQNAALFTGIIGEMSDIGGGGAFSSMSTIIANNGLAIDIMKASLPLIVRNGDMSLLREFTQGNGGAILNGLSPNLAREISSVYNPKHSYNFNQVGTYRTVFDSFDKISDVWDRGMQNGESIGSILGIIAGTKAFKSLIGSGVAWILSSVEDEQKKKRAQQQVLARIYTQSTVSDQIRMYFPKTVMTGKYDKKSKKDETLDIRMIGRSINTLLSL